MAGYQMVIMVGNLTKDPELRYTQSGTPVASFTVAVNRQGKKHDAGEAKDEVLFMPVSAWNKTAEICAEHLKKGRPVLVEGFLREHTWQNPEGQERSRIEMTANRVQFLGGGRREEDAPAPEDSDVPF